MNIQLAELISSIAPEFSVQYQDHRAITFKCGQREIHIEWYYWNGTPWSIGYYKDDEWHRPVCEGPAIMYWNDDGSLILEQYWENGLLLKKWTME